MNIKQLIDEAVDRIVTERLSSLMADDITEPTADTGKRTKRQSAADDTADRTNGRGANRKTYWLTKAGKKAAAAKSLRGNNARVYAVIAKREGLSKSAIWEKVKTHVSTPKSCESNLYQLQTLGLVESRDAD